MAFVRYGGALLALLFVASCGGSSRPTAVSPDVEETPALATVTVPATTTASVVGCPVDQALCDFARQAQADLQRGDPWAFMWSGSADDDPIAGIGGALLRQLDAGRGTPRVVGIGCPDVPGSIPCVRYFSLVFSALAADQIAVDPGFGVALVGLDRGRGGLPQVLGLSLPGGSMSAVLNGGHAGSCGFPDGVGPGCTIHLLAVPTVPDTSLGMGATPLTVGPDVPMPADTNIVIANCGNKGAGGCWEVARFRRLPSGEVEKRVLFTPPPGSTVTGVVTIASGALFLSLCRGEECGLEGSAENAVTDFLRSSDGGVTWVKVAQSARRWWVRGSIGDEALAVDFSGLQAEWVLVPSLQGLARPASAGPDATPVDLGGTAAWADPAAAALWDEGGREAHSLPVPVAGSIAGTTSKNKLGIAAYSRAPQRLPLYHIDVNLGASGPVRYRLNRYLVVGGGFPSSTAISALVRLDRHELETVGWVNDGPLLLVNAGWLRYAACLGATVPVQGTAPALLDPATATLSLIADPFVCTGANVRAVAVYKGPFAEVKTPGDCLNVRETASAGGQILGCYADGVLLGTDGVTGDGQGRSYLHVSTPDGRDGWAAEEFLAR